MKPFSFLASRRLPATDIYSLLAEFELGLSHLNELQQAGNQPAAALLGHQLSCLFKSLLYGQQLEAGQRQLPAAEPVSLATATAKAVSHCQDLADFYQVKLEFKATSRLAVDLAVEAFGQATRSLLFGLIYSLRLKSEPKLLISVGSPQKPRLELISPAIDSSFQSPATGRRPQLVGGLAVATLIYQQLGSPIGFVKRRTGCGFGVGFGPVRQLDLLASRVNQAQSRTGEGD